MVRRAGPHTFGWNWNCTIEPTGASILSGKYFRLPLASATETTCTIISPAPVEAGGGAPLVAIGWHPAGHDAAAPQDPESDPLFPPPQDSPPPPPLLPQDEWSVATAEAARREEIKSVLRDIAAVVVAAVAVAAAAVVVVWEKLGLTSS